MSSAIASIVNSARTETVPAQNNSQSTQATQQSTQQPTQQPSQQSMQQANPMNFNNFAPPQTQFNGDSQTVQAPIQQNNVNFQQAQGQTQGQNIPLQDFIQQLSSVSLDDPQAGNNQQQFNQQQQQHSQLQQAQQQQQLQQQQGNNQQNAQTQSPLEQFTSNILASRQDADFLHGLDIRDIHKRIGQDGDMDAFTESLQTVGRNATAEAVRAFASILPDIAASIREQVRTDFEQTLSRNSQWDQFTQKYPQFGPFKQMMQNDLSKAVKLAQGNTDFAFQNIAAMYHGFTLQNPGQISGGNNNNRNTQQPQEFDIMTFLGSN